MKNSIDSFFINFIDVTVNGQENIFSKYVSHVWKEINLEDYITLCQKNSNKRIQDHEIFIEYSKKLKVKNKNEFFNRIIEIEKEKLLYFILTYPQKIVLVKTGEKQEEKQFLGYKFSNRREHEGIHPIQGGKTIDESTSLFDLKTQENPEKANFYTYKNFLNEDFKIDKTMQKNIFKVDLVDMMTFDRINFEKTISLNVKKNIKIESKLELINLGEVIFEQKKSKIKVKTAKDTENGIYNFFTSGKNILKYKNFLVDGENIYLSTGGIASIKYFKGKASYSTDTFVINSKNENSLKTKLIFYFIENIIDDINKYCFKGQSLKHLQKTDFRNIKIPIPKKNIQEEIVKAIEELEKKEEKNKKRVEELKNKSENFFNENLLSYNLVKLDDILTLQNGKQLSENDRIDGNHFVYGGNGIIGKHNKYISKNETIAIGRVGAYCGVVHKTQPKSWITDNSMLVASFFQEINLDFLYLSLVKLNLNQFASQSSHPNISQSVVLNKKIPLPSLFEQQKIVAQIEKIEQEISELEKINEIIPKQKEEVLKKYL
jgi:type I restriction enzyme M protein